MADFSSLNGYNVKDAQARQDIATLQNTVNTDHESRIGNLEQDTGNLANLTTTDKTNLVNAINEHETNINNITNNINNITNIIDITNNTKVESLVIISDSYGVGNSYPNDITNYGEYMKNSLGLTNDTYYNNSWGGSGFAHVSYDKKFLTLVNECETNLTETRRNNVSHVLIAGGYNDQFNTKEEIIAGIIETTNRAKVLFPNAQIYVAYIGWSTNSSSLNDTCTAYINGCGQTKYAKFINNSQNILRGDTISGDNIHPNEQGYKELSYNLINGLQTGSCYPQSPYKYLKDSNNNNLGVVQANNDNLTFEMYDTEFIVSGTANGTEISYLNLANDSMISGHGNFSFSVPCVFVNNTNSRYVFGICKYKINQRVVTLQPYALNESGNNYFDFTSIRLLGAYINIPHKCI